MSSVLSTVLLSATIIISLIVVLMVAIVVVSVRFLVYHPKSKRRPLHHEEMEHCTLKLTEITLHNAHHQALYAWFAPNKSSPIGDHVLLLQHGHRQNRHEMLRQAQFLHNAGFSVLITTVRAHDRSDGKFIFFGLHEADDLHHWCTYLTEKKRFPARKIGLIGNSMGGVTILRAHTLYGDGAVIILQSVLASLNQTIEARAQYITRLPGILFRVPIAFIIRLWTHFQTNAVQPQLWAKSVSIPVFIMQGGSDTIIPPTSGSTLYNALQTPPNLKEFWYEPRQAHVRFEHDHPKIFQKRLTAFLHNHFVHAKPPKK